jgi:hypothetical protein
MVFVLERDMMYHADDLEPVGVFSTLEAAQEAAQPFERELLEWKSYSGNLGGFIGSSVYPRFRITEVPMNEVKTP